MNAPRIAPTRLPSVYHIPLPTPFPVGDVNVYLAEGEALTLIDCGVRDVPGRMALERALGTLGYRLADIRRLVITHHHTDHLGLAGEIVAESGCEVLAHPLAVGWIERPHEARAAFRAFSGGLMRAAGVPEDEIALSDQVGRYLASLASPAVVAATLDEGDALELGGCMWRVYHTPGHAGDLICFYQPESRVLLASDHILRDVSSNPLLEAPETPGGERPRRLLDYMRELERIAALDIEIAYTGHGEPVEDVRALVAERLALHGKRAARLYDLLRAGPRTVHELGRLMFPHAGKTELFLVISEVIGHLDILTQQGRVRAQTRDSLEFWHALA